MGICYDFEGIPIDSAAKLMYYLEKEELIHRINSYELLYLFTLDAADNFSNPESIKAAVLGAWNVAGVRSLNTGIGEFGLSYSSDNDNSYYVDKDLVVDSLRTLTIRGTVHFCDTCSVIIYPGSKLVIEGGRLTNACPNDLWQGIEVVGDRTKRQLAQYQGTVELRNGATIENAHCAIRTGLAGDAGYATAGGIIRVEDAHFVNNQRSVEFLSYTNHAQNGGVANNQSYFSNCSFTVNDNNLFSQNSVSFIDHVTLWDVRGIDFNGCTFGNATTTQGDRRHAIYAMDAGFTVDKHCTNSSINPNTCVCSAFDSSTFSGFTTAIEVNTTGEQAPVKVDFANFSNNNTALRDNGNNYASFTRCDYNMTNAPFSLTNCGLELNGCSGYKVEGNRFHKPSKNNGLTSTGVCVIDNNTTNNSIYRNIFDTLDYGIHVTGNNGNTSGGLQMTAGKHSGGFPPFPFTDFQSGMNAYTTALAGNDNLDNTDNNNSPNLPNSPTDYSPTINWYALTPAQIAQLQTIAEPQTNAHALSVYPNPTDDLLYLELSGAGIATVALYDLQGRMVYSQNPSNSPTEHSPVATVNMRNIPAGVYVLRVTDGDGKEYRQKVVRR